MPLIERCRHRQRGGGPVRRLDIFDNELDVRGSFRYKNTYSAAVDLLADGAVDVAELVDFTSSLDDVDEAFKRRWSLLWSKE